MQVGQEPSVLKWSDVMYANNHPVPKPLTHNPQVCLERMRGVRLRPPLTSRDAQPSRIHAMRRDRSLRPVLTRGTQYAAVL